MYSLRAGVAHKKPFDAFTEEERWVHIQKHAVGVEKCNTFPCMHAYINFKLLIYCMAMKNDFPFMCEGRNKPCNSPFLQEKLTIFQCIFTLLAFLLLNVLNTFSLYCTIILYFQPNVHTLYLQYFISFYYIFRGGCKLFSDVVISFRL